MANEDAPSHIDQALKNTRSGIPFQYAVVRYCDELFKKGGSRWRFEVAEFPVNVNGADTRIDFVLHGEGSWRAGYDAYLVCECKRPNPAIADWAFLRSPYSRRGRDARLTIFDAITVEEIDAEQVCAVGGFADGQNRGAFALRADSVHALEAKQERDIQSAAMLCRPRAGGCPDRIQTWGGSRYIEATAGGGLNARVIKIAAANGELTFVILPRRVGYDLAQFGTVRIVEPLVKQLRGLCARQQLNHQQREDKPTVAIPARTRSELRKIPARPFAAITAGSRTLVGVYVSFQGVQ